MRWFLFLLALAAGGLHAQSSVAPADPKLALFEPALGTWHGKGLLHVVPGATGTPWEATFTMCRILDGHFVQEDVQVRFPGSRKQPLTARTVYAAHKHAPGFLWFHMDNTGLVAGGRAFWTEGQRLVRSVTWTRGGRLVTDLRELTFAGKEARVRVQRLGPQGAFFDHVVGSLVRGGETCEAASADVNHLGPPPGPEMKALDHLLGAWSFEGFYTPLVGLRPCEVSGRAYTSAILGGHALWTVRENITLSGLDHPHEAQVYTAWDPAWSCYQRLILRNDGTATLQRGYELTNGKLIFTATGVSEGLPYASRTILEGRGDEIRLSTDVSAADAENVVVLDLRLKRLQEELER